MKLSVKKAAMFGLDARIALAIFGALSVISGAALYSAIQDAKVTALITEMNEVGKAYDSYYLDTGEELNNVSLNFYLEIKQLVESSKNGWSGPYTQFKTISTFNHILDHPIYGNVIIAEALDYNWTVQNNWSLVNCVTGTGGECYVWIVVHKLDLDFINAIDKKIDGSIDGMTGNIRYLISGGGDNYLMIKYRPSYRYN